MKQSQVEQLMNQVKNASIDFNPRPEWVAENRTRLLRHIEVTSAAAPRRVFTLNHVWTALSFIMPQKTVYAVVRPAVIFALSIGIGVGGWITTVSASLNSLPGDTLYPVKLASEKTQVAMVRVLQGSAATAELHAALVNRRAQEVQKVVAAAADGARVQAAVAELTSEVQSTNDSLVAAQHAGASSPELVAVAKVIANSVEEIKQNIVANAVHISAADTSSTEVLLAINTLKDSAEKAQVITVATPSAAAGAAATSTAGVTTITTTTAATTSAVHIDHAAPGAAAAATIITTSTASDTLQDFPERPTELSPDVVDHTTPISIEAWQ